MEHLEKKAIIVMYVVLFFVVALYSFSFSLASREYTIIGGAILIVAIVVFIGLRRRGGLLGPPNIDKSIIERDVKGLIKALRYEKLGGERRRAMDILGDIGDARALEPLIGMLKNEDYGLRISAAEALGKLGNTHAVKPLITLLKDQYVDVKRAVANALNKIGPPGLEPLIVSMKECGNSELRKRVTEVLCEFCRVWTIDTSSLELLIAMIKDEDRDVRISAASVLRCSRHALATEALIAALKDEDFFVRKHVVEELGYFGNARAVEPLIVALKDKFFEIRRSVIVALGYIGDARAVDPFIDALKDENDGVRIEAASALGLFHDPRAVEPLVSVLKDKNKDVQRYAAYALVKIGLPAVEQLITVLKHEDRDLRVSTVEVLRSLGDPRALEPLRDLLKKSQKDVNVCIRVAEALGELGDTQTAAESLLAILDDKDKDLCMKAVVALCKLGDTRALKQILGVLKKANIDHLEIVNGELGKALVEAGRTRAAPFVEALEEARILLRRGDVRNFPGHTHTPSGYCSDKCGSATFYCQELGKVFHDENVNIEYCFAGFYNQHPEVPTLHFVD
jgi:HEAT repeat protein